MPCDTPDDDGFVIRSVTLPLFADRTEAENFSAPPGSALSFRVCPPPLTLAGDDEADVDVVCRPYPPEPPPAAPDEVEDDVEAVLEEPAGAEDPPLLLEPQPATAGATASAANAARGRRLVMPTTTPRSAPAFPRIYCAGSPARDRRRMISSRSARRFERRSCASRSRRSSSSVDTSSGGTGTGSPSSSTATIVRELVFVCRTTPLRGASASTRAPTS